MLKNISQFLLVVFVACTVQAQTLTSVIVDSASQKPIPYVTVQLKKKWVVTNEEGRFTFELDNSIQPIDSLFISCIGYASIRLKNASFCVKPIVVKS